MVVLKVSTAVYRFIFFNNYNHQQGARPRPGRRPGHGVPTV
jgi:hypothetical protein